MALHVGSLRRTESVAIEGIADIRRSLAAHANDPQRTSEGGAAGEPDGHPPIGDLDALTEVRPSR